MSSPNSIVQLMRTHFAEAVLVCSLALLTLWTWLALGTDVLSRLDAHSLTPHLAPGSDAAQIWSAIAVVTMPIVFAVVMVALSWWAWKRRMRNLACALLLSVLLGWGSSHMLKLMVQRPRPESPLDDVLTHTGWSYPSGHMAMATTCAVMIVATTTTTRQPRDIRYLWRLVGTLSIVTVAVDRFVMNAHWPSDIVAGALIGLVAGSFSCWALRVHVVPATGDPVANDHVPTRSCAVVWNPSKVLDRDNFRRTLEWELEHHGFNDPLWLTTRRDDPGHAMARRAIEAEVDLVIVAGGDGTVRVVCSELANTGIPVAIIPSGTGNLLARNLAIPLDVAEAIKLAFSGTPRPIDLVRVSVDGRDEGEHFAVMAGIGIDARIMANTPPELKRTVGSAAYFVTGATELTAPPMELTFCADDGPVETRRARLALVGNVGGLQGGIQMMPRATATDGLLDVMISSPKDIARWALMTAKVVGWHSREVDGIDQLQCRRITIRVAEPTEFELDGDHAGLASELVAEVVPGALLLVQPTS